MSLMVFGFFLATPPGIITPDDFLNIFLAHKVLVPLLGVSFPLALFLTYTVVAWGLIFIGASIYPYNTKRLITGKLNLFKAAVLRILHNPILLLISIGFFVLIFKLYYMYIVSGGVQ